MNTVHVEGTCLSGMKSSVDIRQADRFSILLMDESLPPAEINLSMNNIDVENHSVAVGERRKVAVVEHLFSALCGLNHFNVQLEVNGEEIPFFDGSSMDFVEALDDLETRPCAGIRIGYEVYVNDEHGSLHYMPSGGNELYVEMSLNHPYLRKQSFTLNVTPASYSRDVAPARTFVFTDEDDVRLKDLPPYGIGITPINIYARTPLRFPDEPVRHKLLDLLGDLYVLRRPIYGRIIGKNTSHQLNLHFVRELLAAHAISGLGALL